MVSPRMAEILDEIFQDAKKLNPSLTKRNFFDSIVGDWLKLFWKPDTNYKKDKVILKNRVKDALKFCGKSQTQVAKEMGISRCYLGHVVRGNSEPSLVTALLLLQTLNLPPARVGDIFFLESVD